MVKAKSTAPIPPVGQGKRGEQGYLGYLLRQATTAHRQRMEHALADLDVTPPQFSVLTMLGAYPGISNADLARLSLLTPQTVSVIVGNLERRKAIARHAHAIHGRIQQIKITDSGHRLLQRSRERVQEIEKRLLAGLSREAEQAVRVWLVKVAAENPAGG